MHLHDRLTGFNTYPLCLPIVGIPLANKDAVFPPNRIQSMAILHTFYRQTMTDLNLSRHNAMSCKRSFEYLGA